MSPVFFDFLRCVAIAALALAAGWRLGARPAGTRWFWPLVLAPLFTPNLLISYAWARVAYSLGSWPGAALAFYSAALALKLIPLAALARHFFPPPLSAQGAHCHGLAVAGSPRECRMFTLRAAGPMPWIVLALLFLVVFPEFELASLWSLKTWPVALFDAHTGGLALGESLRLAAPPALIQLAVLAVIVTQTRRPFAQPEIEPARSANQSGPLIFAIASAGIVTLWPLGLVTFQAIQGIQTLTRNSVLPRDLLASLIFSSLTAALAWLISGFGQRRNAGAAVFAALPGLLGALVIALAVLALFQLPGLRALYDTPLPLLLALTVIVLPGALLLRWLLSARRPDEALHAARLARSRRLSWELAGQPRFAAVALLGCWAWFDFTASSILAPLGLAPVFVRLHNLAHYGQTAAMSALLFAATVAPIAVLALTLGAARLYARRDAR